MAHFGPKNDCLHSCLPGPVDTWIQLAFNAIEGRADLIGSKQATAVHGQRWFSTGNESRWLRRRGTSYAFEFCSAETKPTCWQTGHHVPLHKQAAWLFVRHKHNASLNTQKKIMEAFLEARSQSKALSPPSPPEPPAAREILDQSNER